eukprot:COSAG02_NODE_4022_length_5891_cov_111.561119_2_plen_50_part_00
MPPPKLLKHEPSGCELRAFGMEFGQTTGCDRTPRPAIAVLFSSWTLHAN